MMKRWVAVGMTALMLMTAREARAESVSAQAAVVMEQSTGRVLMEKNADAVLPMASTTKIMTGILALEALVYLDRRLSHHHKRIIGAMLGRNLKLA